MALVLIVKNVTNKLIQTDLKNISYEKRNIVKRIKTRKQSMINNTANPIKKRK